MLFTEVIKTNKEFSKVYKKGRFCVCESVCVYYLKNSTPYNKLGITTPKKLGNAVVRNRARRIIRAAYRESEQYIPLGYDLVVVARNGIVDKKSSDIKSFFMKRLINDMRKNENKKGIKK